MNIAGQPSYEAARENFSWSQRWKLFDIDPASFNLSERCIDEPVSRGNANAVAARVAGQDGTTEYTYAELQTWSRRLGHFIMDQGLVTGDALTIMVNPGLTWLVAHFAALRVGCPVVPSSPVVGTETLRKRLEKSETKLLIADPQELDFAKVSAAYPDCRFLTPNDVAAVIHDPAAPEYAEIDARGTDEAASVFSSGTTGNPKRTRMSHNSFVWNAVVVGSFVLGLEPSDRFMKLGSTAWGGAFGWGIVTPMLHDTAGGIYSGPFDAETVSEAAETFGLTALWCPPSGLRKLIKESVPLKTVNKIAYAGEAAGKDLFEEVRRVFGVELRGHYGATEIGMFTLDYAYDDYVVRPGSIGKPVLDAKVAVINGDDQPVPTGESGELALERGGRWRRAGDVGYVDHDGYFWLTGRADDVIISGGYTIGPDEVEEAVRLEPAVDDVAVIGVPDPERGSIVKAFVVLKPGHDRSDTLRSQIVTTVRESLGRYAYPRIIEFVDTLPRGPAGKVQRSELRRQEA